MAILDHEHQMILEEDQIRRLQDERRFAVPGCPWDCEDGWREIAFSEFGPLDLIPLPDPTVIVLPHGLILIACECNSTKGGGVRRYPDWFGGERIEVYDNSDSFSPCDTCKNRQGKNFCKFLPWNYTAYETPLEKYIAWQGEPCKAVADLP